jgi:hypothetical protein
LYWTADPGLKVAFFVVSKSIKEAQLIVFLLQSFLEMQEEHGRADAGSAISVSIQVYKRGGEISKTQFCEVRLCLRLSLIVLPIG